MKLLLLSALVAVALSQPTELSEQDIEKWEEFKIEYERDYSTEEEEVKRKAIFMKNLKFIQEHNEKYEKGEVTFDVGVNQFADLTTEEFAVKMNGYKQSLEHSRKGEEFDEPEDVELPSTVDWRKKGAVTKIKNQGQCGSCWAFSATGSIEGQHFLKNKKLVSLSEQNLVDCSGAEGNDGCNGGLMDQAFEYVIKNKGIDTEKSYPYEAEDDTCRYKVKNRGATVKSYVDIPTGSEKKLQIAVAKKGPISVAMDASLNSFQLYKSGVYKDPKCKSDEADLDHGVLAVGYGTAKKGGAYWLVKNSWGTDWGMKGYFMLARNHHNECGIATAASYPKV